jgi:hypothetical protein
MRILVTTLGFAYHHILASANRCRPNKIVLVTVDSNNERTKNAIHEVELYAKVINAGVEVVERTPEDFWRCVGDSLELFADRHEYYLGVGGGVRALVLCLYTAATLAVAHLGARLMAIYTIAEHSEAVVEVDLRPLLYAGRLVETKAKARREALFKLAQAGALEDVDKRIYREFEQYGITRDKAPTAATYMLQKLLQLRYKAPP